MNNDGQSTSNAAGCLTCGAVVLLVAGLAAAGLGYVAFSVSRTPPPPAPSAPVQPAVSAGEVDPAPIADPVAPAATPVAIAAASTPAPSLLGYDLSDDRDVRQLVASMRSMGAVYAAATPDEREDLLGLLQSTGRLRRDLGELLPVESDSAARAMILGAVEPKGYFEGRANDPELEALLEAVPATPIGEAEWLARIDLAGRLSPAALERTLARLSTAGNETPATRLLADVWRAQSTETGPAARTRREAARQSLRGDFDAGAYDDVDASLAARGYQALATGPDAARDIDWMVSRLAREHRPAARDALARAIERLARPDP